MKGSVRGAAGRRAVLRGRSDRRLRARAPRLAGAALSLALLALAVPVPAAAQVPPHAEWRTLDTENFRITFSPGLEPLARHAAARAEVLRSRLDEVLAPAPAGTIDILLADGADMAAGFAQVRPSKRIVLYAWPPVDRLTLQYYADWIDTLLLHELAHVVHLDPPSRIGRPLRRAFGRAPTAWPLFPGLDTPTWLVEGLATHLESRLTGYGRVHGPVPEMVVRTAALEGRLEGIGQADGLDPRWPGAQRPYFYGALFFDFLTDVYGDDAAREILRRTIRSPLPPWLVLDRIGARAFGESFTGAWTAWLGGVEARYHALAAELGAEGLTEPQRLTAGGYFELHPRVDRSGDAVAFTASDGREDPSAWIYDPATGDTRRLARHAGLGTVSWLPDGGLVTSQLEFTDPYHIRRDLYRLMRDGTERRLTHGARLAEPDADNRGRIVALQFRAGTNRLVVHHPESGETTPLTPYLQGVHWSRPRWSPEGDRIAAGRLRGGIYDIVLVDAEGAILDSLAASRALTDSPAWSPDGRYVLFWSDRTGIPNLFAADLAARTPPGPRIHQVTNLLSGAFHPDVSPDARWIYFAGYASDGFHLARVPFDPGTWREADRPGEIADARSGGTADSVIGAGGTGAGAVETGADGATEPRRYRAWHTLAPGFWVPTAADRGRAGRFVGAYTAGTDLVGRHAYELQARVSGQGRAEGRLAYSWAGLGNPVLTLSARREWGFAGIVSTGPDRRHDVLDREHDVAVAAVFRHRRRWHGATLAAGAEYVVRDLRIVASPAEFEGFVKPRDVLIGPVVQATFSNARIRAFSIGPEDGVTLRITGRDRRDTARTVRASDGARFDASSREATGRLTAYHSLRWPGFANHGLAGRVGVARSAGPGAGTYALGGAPGQAVDLGLIGIGSRARLLPLRGFAVETRRGTRAWSASVEYRAPVALISRGAGVWPLFLDRLSATLFVDAGNAWCSRDQIASGHAGCSPRRAPPLTSAGAELVLDLHAIFILLRLRPGVAFTGDAGIRPYFVLGSSF